MGNMYFMTTEVAGLGSAIMAMRNPKDSWDMSDSELVAKNSQMGVALGKKDATLSKKLRKAGTEHAKHLRMIQVWVDVVMPRYWWQEADTYHFGTKVSCSTMHTIHKNPFTTDDFYFDENVYTTTIMNLLIADLNALREQYLESKDYKYVKYMKQVLPESFLQLRSWNTNYAELLNIYKQRKDHRLKEEWGLFCEWCESLPHFKELCLDD